MRFKGTKCRVNAYKLFHRMHTNLHKHSPFIRNGFSRVACFEKKKKDCNVCKTMQSLLHFDLFPLAVNRPSRSFISKHPVQVSESRKR